MYQDRIWRIKFLSHFPPHHLFSQISLPPLAVGPITGKQGAKAPSEVMQSLWVTSLHSRERSTETNGRFPAQVIGNFRESLMT